MNLLNHSMAKTTGLSTVVLPAFEYTKVLSLIIAQLQPVKKETDR